MARAAQEKGFGSLWVGEHVVMPVDYERVYPGSPDGEAPSFAGLLSSPLIALARAAAVTQRLRIGTGVCLLPLREPIALANRITSYNVCYTKLLRWVWALLFLVVLGALVVALVFWLAA